MLVLGHSDSDGSQLADAQDSWPQVVVRGLPELSIELSHRTLFPGRSATRFIEKELAATTPDIVIVAVSSFSAAFEFVSNRLRDVVGGRAASVAIRLEHLAGDLSVSHQRVHQATIAPRRVARRLLGARSTSTVEATLSSYQGVIQRLAREENAQTIVLGGKGYTRYHETMNPKMRAIRDLVEAEIGRMAEAHHFDWVFHEALLGGPDAKHQFFLPDGVHCNERSHRLVADAIIPLVGSRWGGR